MIPLLVLFYFYSAIFKAIKYAVHMRAFGALEINEELNLEENKQENEINLEELRQTFKFSKGLFVMFIMYLFTLIPLCLSLVIDSNQEKPSYFLMYPWVFFRLCSAATPVVYPLFHSSIRHGYKEAIDRYVLRKKKLLIKPKRKPLQIKKKRIMETKLKFI